MDHQSAARPAKDRYLPCMSSLKCRFCRSCLQDSFIDLGTMPLANCYLRADQLNQVEAFYPLHAWVCSKCFLVQVGEVQSAEQLFRQYAYFSSYSETWLRHASEYASRMIERLGLGPQNLVIEIGSNDGYLLQYFKRHGVPVLGIEPAQNVAEVAVSKGIPTISEFFESTLATKLFASNQQADLVVLNNVLAHVPDLNGFMDALRLVLKPDGILTVEFPHLLRMIEGNQFDTIYHEHLSYFSCCTAKEIFERHGFVVFDVEEFPTHGGSLRLYVMHADQTAHSVNARVSEVCEGELSAGLWHLETYSRFPEAALEVKYSLLEFLLSAKRADKTVVGYGAPAKGNTLLNYCGIGEDLLGYTVDASPHKQQLFLPGSHIPIRHPETIRLTRPDYVLLLPWNLQREIVEELSYARQWGCRFVIPIPRVQFIA